MAGSVFPPAGVKEDSSQFSKSFKDNTVEVKTDGGYSYTRPRSARRPRRIFKTGFTNLNTTEESQVSNFMAIVGKHTIFTYIVPTTGEAVSVRFTGELPESKYVGVGGTHRYNIADVEMTEV